MSNKLTDLLGKNERIVLINAPAVDVRFPWSRWQQPIGVIRIGNYLIDQGYDVRLIDCQYTSGNQRLKRKKVGEIVIDDYHINLWRYGLSPTEVLIRLNEWQKHDWKPDLILVSCGMSFWWKGAKELIHKLKETFKKPIIIGGLYPTFYSEHAEMNAEADHIFIGDVEETREAATDLCLYAPNPLPRFAGIHLMRPSGLMTVSQSARNPEEIADEVQKKAFQGVKTFAFYDSWVGPEHYQPISAALEAILERKIIGINFIALGNFSPRLIDDELAILFKQVGYKHIYLHDDILHNPLEIHYLSSLEDYSKSINSLHLAGFSRRTGEIGAAVMLGLPGEDLNTLTERLVFLSSIVGSLHLVPFQFTNGTTEGKAYENWMTQRDGYLDITNLNGRTFPLVRMMGANYEDYLDIIRLVALLNSKYRSQSFDFLGSSLTAKLVRNSLIDNLWDPFTESKISEKEVQNKYFSLPMKE